MSWLNLGKRLGKKLSVDMGQVKPHQRGCLRCLKEAASGLLDVEVRDCFAPWLYTFFFCPTVVVLRSANPVACKAGRVAPKAKHQWQHIQGNANRQLQQQVLQTNHWRTVCHVAISTCHMHETNHGLSWSRLFRRCVFRPPHCLRLCVSNPATHTTELWSRSLWSKLCCSFLTKSNWLQVLSGELTRSETPFWWVFSDFHSDFWDQKPSGRFETLMTWRNPLASNREAKNTAMSMQPTGITTWRQDSRAILSGSARVWTLAKQRKRIQVKTPPNRKKLWWRCCGVSLCGAEQQQQGPKG